MSCRLLLSPLLVLALALAGCPDPRRTPTPDDDDVANDDDSAAVDDDDATDDDDTLDPDEDTDGDGITNGEEQVYGEDCVISDPLIADTDGDGVDDGLDPYPLDPYPEYILHRNDYGTIDLTLSNRDGTFEPTVQIGLPFGDTTNKAYRYTQFLVADFDSNGGTDFLAVGDADPSDSSNATELWWFGRQTGPQAFTQRKVEDTLVGLFVGTLADLDDDDDMDVLALERNPGGNVTSAVLWAYLNTGLVVSADCAWTDDPANPDGCAFVRVQAADITPWAEGQWVIRMSRDAVDVDGDGFRDVALIKQSSGGNVEQPLALSSGDGSGLMTQPGGTLLTHNLTGSGQSPIQSIVFADFDNDEVGDVIVGFDDDGDSGSGWFYPGTLASGSFAFDSAAAFEAIDLNPAVENGSDDVGVSTSARAFDLDFDGNMDVLLGYAYEGVGSPPSRTSWFRGAGDGTFEAEVVVVDLPSTTFGGSFALPQALCRSFPTE